MATEKPKYRIYITNTAGDRLTEVRQFDECRITSRFNSVGTWRLSLRKQTREAELLGFGGLGKGIEVTRDHQVIYQGPVNEQERAWSSQRNAFVASGYDNMVYLAWRLCYPEPANNPGDWTTNTHDVRTDAASTVMYEYVDYNAGSNALLPRQVAGLTLATDTSFGNTVTGRARCDVLIELLQDLALIGGGLGFRMNGLEFEVYEPTDKSDSIIFSPGLQNVESFSYKLKYPNATRVIAGGSGEGLSRVFVEKNNGASETIFGRREIYYDRRNVAAEAELTDAAYGELLKQIERVSINLSPIDIHSQQFKADYFLGDDVSILVDGEAVTGVVQEATLVIGQSQTKLQPFIGSISGLPNRPLADIYAKVDEIVKKLKQLERSN